MNTTAKLFLLSGLFVLNLPQDLLANDEGKDGESCISANHIRHTRIIDDATILFYIRGSKVYRNTLPRQCKGLAREDRFSYRRTSSQLCRNDSIRILQANAGGYREGRSCALGSFFEMTDEDVERMLNPPDNRPPAVPLPPAEPEEVIEDTPEA